MPLTIEISDPLAQELRFRAQWEGITVEELALRFLEAAVQDWAEPKKVSAANNGGSTDATTAESAAP